MTQPLWEIVWKFLRNLKKGLSAVLPLGMQLKKTKTVIQRKACTPVFIAALFIIAKIWKQPKCPSTDK